MMKIIATLFVLSFSLFAKEDHYLEVNLKLDLKTKQVTVLLKAKSQYFIDISSNLNHNNMTNYI